MNKPFQVGGMWFKRIKGSRVPIVLGGIALVAAPLVAQAKGPIVRASPDWWALLWALINNT